MASPSKNALPSGSLAPHEPARAQLSYALLPPACQDRKYGGGDRRSTGRHLQRGGPGAFLVDVDALLPAAAAFAVPLAVCATQALPAVESESASPGRGHRGLLGLGHTGSSNADPRLASTSSPGLGVCAELALDSGGDEHEGDEEPEPVARSTSGCDERDQERHAEVPLRRVRAVRSLGEVSIRLQGRRDGHRVMASPTRTAIPRLRF